jgi:glycosyltransferase involved in cell wall biosynthesis
VKVQQNERRLSVCMATYNGSLYLREQLDSILKQLDADDELIVSDDHSTDDTPSILASYRDARIRAITNHGRRGHVQNFARAMLHATGEFIALSDQDDVWVEGRLQRMLGQLLQMPKNSLVVGGFTEFDSNGIRPIQPSIGASPTNRFVQMIGIFLGRYTYFGSAFLFRRELTRYVLPIPDYIEAHDIWIAMNANIRGEIAHVEETTLMRRLHGNNLTPMRRRSLPKVLRSRVFYLLGLLQSSFR